MAEGPSCAGSLHTSTSPVPESAASDQDGPAEDSQAAKDVIWEGLTSRDQQTQHQLPSAPSTVFTTASKAAAGVSAASAQCSSKALLRSDWKELTAPALPPNGLYLDLEAHHATAAAATVAAAAGSSSCTLT